MKHHCTQVRAALSAPIELFLSRLPGAKQTAAGRWMFPCPNPAHDDRHPSAWAKEGDTGAVVFGCFGCGDQEGILAGLGLEWADIFPSQTGRDFDASIPHPRPPRFTAAELVRLAAFESGIVAIAGGDLLNGAGLAEQDEARLRQAVDTLLAIFHEVNP